MEPSVRAALIRRISPYLEVGVGVPQNWSDLPLTTALLIESNDPEAAAVFKGKMGPELECRVLSGDWADAEPVIVDHQAERQASIDAALAQLTPRTQEELQQRIQDRLENEQAQRQNSLRLAGLG